MLRFARLMDLRAKKSFLNPVVFVLLASAGFVWAWPGLRAPFILDDQIRIVENLDIRSLKDLPHKLIYPYGEFPVYTRNDPSRPLVSLTYALNYHFGKLDPLGYHVVDVVTHVGVSFLIFLYFGFLFRRLGIDSKSPPAPVRERGEWGDWAAFFVSLCFLCHPVLFGTVMYAYGRSDTLSAFWILLSLSLYSRGRNARVAMYWVSVASFILALLTKESAIVLPAILVAQDLLIPSTSAELPPRGRWRRWAPFFLVGGVYMAFRYFYFGALGDLVGGKNAWERWAYVSVQPYVIIQYLRMLLVPVGLAIDHFIQPSTLTADDKILGWLALGAIALGVWRWGRGAGSGGRTVIFLTIIFFLLLAPTTSFLPTVDAMVERRMYPAAAAAIGVLVLIAFSAAERLPVRLRSLRIIAVIAPLLALGWITSTRNTLIMDPAAVWAGVLEVYPDSPRALNNLAVIQQVRGRPEEAFKAYERLIAFNPNDYIAHMNIARIYENPSFPGVDRGRARLHYETSVQIEPAFADGHYNFGRFLQVEEDSSGAEREYLRVLEINPNYVQAHNNLGLLYFRMGRPAEAENFIRRAMELDPTYRPAQTNWEMLQGGSGPVVGSGPSDQPGPDLRGLEDPGGKVSGE